jgi:hypothetical protein
MVQRGFSTLGCSVLPLTHQADVRELRITQRAQVGDQSCLLVLAEIEGSDQRGEIRISTASPVIEFDHFLQGREASVRATLRKEGVRNAPRSLSMRVTP